MEEGCSLVFFGFFGRLSSQLGLVVFSDCLSVTLLLFLQIGHLDDELLARLIVVGEVEGPHVEVPPKEVSSVGFGSDFGNLLLNLVRSDEIMHKTRPFKHQDKM